MSAWRDMWGSWCAAHPTTVFYLVAIGIGNLVLNVLDLVLR